MSPTWLDLRTLLEKHFRHVISIDIAVKVLKALEDTFAQDFIEHELDLSYYLSIIKKDTDLFNEYLRCFKCIYDNLAAIKKLVSDQSKVLPLLRELRDGCESFITTILKPHVRSFKSLGPFIAKP